MTSVDLVEFQGFGLPRILSIFLNIRIRTKFVIRFSNQFEKMRFFKFLSNFQFETAHA